MIVCEYLSLNGLIVPKPIRTRNNKLVLVYQDEVIVIQTFIEGAPYVDEDDNALNLDEHLEFYGRKTGEFHKASLTMVEELDREIFRVGRSGIEYTKFIAEKYMPEDEYIKEQYKQWENEINSLHENALTEAVIHGDIGSNDFFFYEEEYSGLIDLNSAYNDYLLYDLAPSFMYTGLFKADQEERVRIFLKAYFEDTPVKVEEVNYSDLKDGASYEFSELKPHKSG